MLFNFQFQEVRLRENKGSLENPLVLDISIPKSPIEKGGLDFLQSSLCQNYI